MKLLQFTPPLILPIYESVRIATLTSEFAMPVQAQLRYRVEGGGYVVASIVSGDEYDAAEGDVLLIEEACVLDNDRWTWAVITAANNYECDGVSSENVAGRGHYSLPEVRVAQFRSEKPPPWWRDEINRMWRLDKIVLGGECDPLERELETRKCDDFSRMTWQAYHMLRHIQIRDETLKGYRPYE